MNVIKKQIVKSIIHGTEQDLQSNHDSQSIKSKNSGSNYRGQKQKNDKQQQIDKRSNSKYAAPI